MGLDMFVYSCCLEDLTDENFKVGENPIKENKENEIFYWRKHPNLHGWMEELYRDKGGKEDFNCEYVRLEKEDIKDLEAAINDDALPLTSGFFFGKSTDEDTARDLEFLKIAKEQLESGKVLLYYAWW
jgi:hypothetical protein